MRGANIDCLRGAVLYLRRNGCFEFSGAIADAISELDTLRAQNAALVSAATAGATVPCDCHNGQTNPRAISGDKASYLAQGGANV